MQQLNREDIFWVWAVCEPALKRIKANITGTQGLVLEVEKLSQISSPIEDLEKSKSAIKQDLVKKEETGQSR